MVVELTLTHPCGGTVQLVARTWTTRGGTAVTHCDTCGEWLGSAFIRAEERILVKAGRRQRQLPGVR